jgi:hypothetical protein
MLIHNLNDETEVTQTQDLIDKINLVRTKNNNFPNKKRKVVIIGDNHARGCATEVSNNLGKTLEVSGIVMPGCRLEAITQLAKREIYNLTKEGVVVVWGGANDISKNESTVRLRHIKNFVVNWKHMNIVIINSSHRHDLPAPSYINKEVQVYNRKLYKIMKRFDHVKIIEMNLTKEYFMQRGLHMNTTSEEWMAKLIASNIKQILTRQKIPLSPSNGKMAKWTSVLMLSYLIFKVIVHQNPQIL